ncbi:hypothetical protein B0T18DRAFT_431708 [Schizothecium vesticola]|uniref:Protein kinase domain-containing protein n=1 Tax=Schizothecium vesticola TaxID=314040 RepID=A0AA40EJA8_9PEZI|nr:hypothetical protein B0T18DRAFT_431708 [Schizothecium vesticola]
MTMEVTSLVFAIVTLLDTSLTVTRLYSSNKNFSPDSKSLALALLWQHSRFKFWTKTWQIPIDGNASAAAASLLEKELRQRELDLKVFDQTLRSMKALLSEGEKLTSRHHQDDGELEKNVSVKVKDALKRFKWLIIDMDRFKQVIASLRIHNDDLWHVAPRDEACSPESAQIVLTCEAMATISALGLALPQSPSETAYPVLSQTVRMRARLDSVHGATVISLDIELAFQEWKDKVFTYNAHGDASVPLSGVLGKRQTARYLKGHGKLRTDLDVMVEWKQYGPTKEVQSLALERSDRVARLLSGGALLPDDIRALRCVGYFENADARRVRTLFELPALVAAQGASSVEVVTLADELANPAYEASGGGMLLSHRFHLAWTLARAVLKLHLSGWLHKDIRSDNVIFFKPGGQVAVNLAAPYLAGFGFARPDQILLASESQYAQDNEALALGLAYCHPEYQHSTERMEGQERPQGDPPRQRYHRTYDVYSLGCVLLEIGIWRSLESLKWRKYRAKRAEWRDRLIRYAHEWLGFMCGAAYRDVVVKCLSSTADPQGDPSEDESERVKEFCWAL